MQGTQIKTRGLKLRYDLARACQHWQSFRPCSIVCNCCGQSPGLSHVSCSSCPKSLRIVTPVTLRHMSPTPGMSAVGASQSPKPTLQHTRFPAMLSRKGPYTFGDALLRPELLITVDSGMGQNLVPTSVGTECHVNSKKENPAKSRARSQPGPQLSTFRARTCPRQ